MEKQAKFRAIYKTIDDQDIDTDVYLPQPGARAKHPVSTAAPFSHGNSRNEVKR
jgi:hypothetical protein